jgi:hypothetical protein
MRAPNLSANNPDLFRIQSATPDSPDRLSEGDRCVVGVEGRELGVRCCAAEALAEVLGVGGGGGVFLGIRVW